MAAGFLAPLFILGLSGGVGTQAGFITPLPVFPAGANAAVQAGFQNPLPVWMGGAGLPVEPEPETRRKGGGYTPDRRHWERLHREDEEILAVIMAYMETKH